MDAKTPPAAVQRRAVSLRATGQPTDCTMIIDELHGGHFPDAQRVQGRRAWLILVGDADQLPPLAQAR